MNEEKIETVDIELPDDVILRLSLMAHEQDITLNQLMVNIVAEAAEKEIAMHMAENPDNYAI